MPRVVLILPTATYRAEDFLEAAASLGADVVVATEEAPTLADQMGDRVLVIPLDAPDRAARLIADHHDRSPIDAVVGVDDQGIVTAAMAAERLGLVHNRPDAVAATRDKRAQRERLTGAGLHQPRYLVVDEGEDPAGAASTVGWPAVVKPVGLSGSQGVVRVDGPDDLAEVVDRVRSIAARAGAPGAGSVVIEQFVPGREYAVEGIVRSGTFETLALFDKPDALDGPYFEETIYVTPSRLPQERQALVRRAAADAVSALDLTEGPVHVEVRLERATTTVLEVAARSIGGHCSRVLRFGAGISLEQVILSHALGLPAADIDRAGDAAGVMMVPIPATGVLRGVRGLDRAAAVDGVQGIDITVAPGSTVEALPDGSRYLGFLFVHGGTPDGVEASLRAGHAALDIDIEVVAGVEAGTEPA